MKRSITVCATFGLSLLSNLAYAENDIGAKHINAFDLSSLHMLTINTSFILLVFAFLIGVYAMWAHRKAPNASEGRAPYRESVIGQWSWITVPVIALCVNVTITDATNNLPQTTMVAQPHKSAVEASAQHASMLKKAIPTARATKQPTWAALVMNANAH